MRKNILKPEFSGFQLILLFVLLSFFNVYEAWAQKQSPSPSEGRYIAYYENGKTREKGFYLHAQKHKTWHFYNPDGSLDHKEKWISGELQWQIFYNKRGRIIKTIDKKGVVKTRPACGC